MIFAPTKPAQIARKQLLEAERMKLEHAAAREYHAAIEAMADERIKRLIDQLKDSK